MGKWLNKTLKPTDSLESQTHADIEDLARLVEGTLDSAERERLIRHLNRCGKCYEILQEIKESIYYYNEKQIAREKAEEKERPITEKEGEKSCHSPIQSIKDFLGKGH